MSLALVADASAERAEKVSHLEAVHDAAAVHNTVAGSNLYRVLGIAAAAPAHDGMMA